MANQPELDQWDAGVYQLEKTDPVLAGLGGVSNTPLLNLANRTKYLYNRIAEILGISKNYALAGGTANAITGAYTPAVSALVDGMTLKFKAGLANTGATTFTPNTASSGGIAAAPIYGLDLQPLTGGEIVVSGNCAVQWNASLNSGNGAWVLVENSGGLRRTATPAPMDSSNQVANTAALMAALGLQTVSLAGAAAAVTLNATQAGGGIIVFTGALSQNTTVTLPNVAKVYTVINKTTGAYSLTLQAGTGAANVVLGQGNAAELYADGANNLANGITQGVTPPQFDNSPKLATMAALWQRGHSYGAQVVINAAQTLTAAQVAGKEVTITAGVNVTLPLASTCPAGTVIHFCSQAAGAGILRQGSDVLSMTPSNQNCAMGLNDSLVLMSDGIGVWLGIGGTLQLGASGVFGSSLAASGYQKLPSGLIVQWGSTTNTSQTGTITLPLAFPNACLQVVGTFLAAQTTYMYSLVFNTVTKTGFNWVKSSSTSGTAGAAGEAFMYMAVGY